jgi:hypothetical protein
MSMIACSPAALLDLPLEILMAVCQQLDLHDLVRVAATCKRLRHGDSAQDGVEDESAPGKRSTRQATRARALAELARTSLQTVQLPSKSPVVTALREFAFPGGDLIPSTRPTGCSESWVAYLTRCARQRRCREAPLIAAGWDQTVFADATRRLLACGRGAAAGHGDKKAYFFAPTPVLAMAGVKVRSVAAGPNHSLALSWDGQVYSWGKNKYGQLGQGENLTRLAPVLVEGLEGVRSIAAASVHSFAVTIGGRLQLGPCSPAWSARFAPPDHRRRV